VADAVSCLFPGRVSRTGLDGTARGRNAGFRFAGSITGCTANRGPQANAAAGAIGRSDPEADRHSQTNAGRETQTGSTGPIARGADRKNARSGARQSGRRNRTVWVDARRMVVNGICYAGYWVCRRLFLASPDEPPKTRWHEREDRNMARNSLIVLLFAMVASMPVMAERLYKWVDQHGNISYQDRPPPEGRGGKVEEKSLGDRRRGATSPDPGSDGAQAPVTLYTTSGCTPCDQARVYLKGREIPFREIDVSSRNPQAQQEMQKKVGELQVPTLTIGPKVLRGFTEPVVANELEQAGYPKPEKPASTIGENQ